MDCRQTWLVTEGSGHVVDAEPELLVGLDIGASKVTVVVAERDDVSGEAQIIGIGQAAALGIRKGLVVNLEQAVQSVRRAVDDARNIVGLPIEEVTVAFGGSDVTSIRSRGMISLGRTSRQVTVEDIGRVIEAAQTEIVPALNQTIVHTIPIEYAIDGHSGIDDPLGMTGVRLEMELQSLIAPTSVVQNVLTCVERAGLRVLGIIIKPLASALGVLTAEEAGAGAVVIDVGAGITGVAVYSEGKPKRLAVIPVGGDHVTNDLACVLRIPMSKADLLKREVSLDEDGERLDDELEFENRGKTFTCTVREVVDVISSRLEELFGTLVETEIAEANVSVLPAGVVLTGGVANTFGIERLVSHFLDMPVRVGRPLDVHRMPPERNGVEYATAAGIIRYVVERERSPQKYLDPFQGAGEPRRKIAHPVRSTEEPRGPWIKGNPFAGFWTAVKKTLKELF